MIDSLSKIWGMSKICLFQAFIAVTFLVIALVMASIGAWLNVDFSNVHYPLAIGLVVAYFFWNFIWVSLFLSKYKKVAPGLQELRNDYRKLVNFTLYFLPIYSFSRISKITFNLLSTLKDDDFMGQMIIDNNKYVLSSDRLNLRHFRQSDLEFVYKYRNNPNVNCYQSYDAFSKTEIKNMIETYKNCSLTSDNGMFAIVDKNNKTVGEMYTSYKMIDNEYFIGFTIAPEYQRRGYAFEIVSELLVYMATTVRNIKFVCAVYEKNIPSINLVKKLEFKKTSWFKDEKGKVLLFSKKTIKWRKLIHFD